MTVRQLTGPVPVNCQLSTGSFLRRSYRRPIQAHTAPPEVLRVNFTADVSLLPADIREDLARELIEILERDPVQVAEQVRLWMAEETA